LGKLEIFYLQNMQTESGSHTGVPFEGYQSPSSWVKRPGRHLTTCLQLMTTLTMSGSIPLLPLFAFMEWTGKYLPLRVVVIFVYSII
jgi:hypothetical protein